MRAAFWCHLRKKQLKRGFKREEAAENGESKRF
jgi:hypothetical protein